MTTINSDAVYEAARNLEEAKELAGQREAWVTQTIEQIAKYREQGVDEELITFAINSGLESLINNAIYQASRVGLTQI